MAASTANRNLVALLETLTTVASTIARRYHYSRDGERLLVLKHQQLAI